jgi:hypothetical protein
MTWKQIRLQVFERDEYKCQICGLDTFPRLDVHHMKKWKDSNGNYWQSKKLDDLITAVDAISVLILIFGDDAGERRMESKNDY